jgi:hypothetical protein
MSNYISPGEAWFTFLLWTFVCVGSLGGVIYLVRLWL